MTKSVVCQHSATNRHFFPSLLNKDCHSKRSEESPSTKEYNYWSSQRNSLKKSYLCTMFIYPYNLFRDGDKIVI